ncbi:MAG: tyrosine-type recombinase/integrase [Phycisphaerales bacterium]
MGKGGKPSSLPGTGPSTPSDRATSGIGFPAAIASSACLSFATTSSGRCRLRFEPFIKDSSRPFGPDKSLTTGGPVQRTPIKVVIKTDDRGRTIDVHALRHTFGTHLSKAGVPLRTAQAAMRHSDPSLTANVYTDPKLLDVAGAVASLPDLPLGTAAWQVR